MGIKHLSEKRVIALLNQLAGLAPELTRKILSDHQKNDSELYDAILKSACDFYDYYYDAYLAEVRNSGIPAIERSTRDQIAADLAADFEGLTRKVEFLLYAAFEDIGNFGVLKNDKNHFVFAGFPFFGEEMMNRAYETSPDSNVSFYSMITGLDEDIYLPFFVYAFRAVDMMDYDWLFIPNGPPDDLPADLEPTIEDYIAPEVDEESRARLEKLFDYLTNRGFSGKNKDANGLKKYNVPPVIIGYFDQFGRFPEGYAGER
jgi:hypothetical protein